jgi:hypothetical protein
VIEGKIIEHVREFKYVGGKISDFRNVMLYKLQTYVRKNGIVGKAFSVNK